MPVTLSPRLQAIALTPMERIAIYVERKLVRFRPYYDTPFSPGRGECFCGKPSVGRNECADCKRKREESAKDRTAFHACDMPFHLDTEEWLAAAERKREQQNAHGRKARRLAKMSQTLDNDREPVHPLDRIYASVRS